MALVVRPRRPAARRTARAPGWDHRKCTQVRRALRHAARPIPHGATRRRRPRWHRPQLGVRTRPRAAAARTTPALEQNTRHANLPAHKFIESPQGDSGRPSQQTKSNPPHLSKRHTIVRGALSHNTERNNKTRHRNNAGQRPTHEPATANATPPAGSTAVSPSQTTGSPCPTKSAPHSRPTALTLDSRPAPDRYRHLPAPKCQAPASRRTCLRRRRQQPLQNAANLAHQHDEQVSNPLTGTTPRKQPATRTHIQGSRL
ncbi:hypothetical protein SAMN05444920_103553 [Nonomuraea solani]|uniref:Uncharacterized protein n=1 Tax=Nonomuraea solani TaxID=1144553 RepID=A0A1H6BQL5_9ACTN|nr:hypothetical protein SAMN05444920_103553 [Nonomuraea solani]